tara:strand:+ start:3105 stop:3443 length:339 start_codon:yes stop_codon:yes gene_type:complete
MNAHSIKEYILKLEKENMALREELESSTNGRYIEISDDDESVTSADDVNQHLSKRFYEKAAAEDNPHKKRAFRTAGDVIGQLDFDVECGKDIVHLRGIGRSAVRLIDEWLKI